MAEPMNSGAADLGGAADFAEKTVEVLSEGVSEEG